VAQVRPRCSGCCPCHRGRLSALSCPVGSPGPERRRRRAAHAPCAPRTTPTGSPARPAPGGSLGPEAALLALCGAAVSGVASGVFGFRGKRLRDCALMGMTAGLAAFFGVALGGSLFALEARCTSSCVAAPAHVPLHQLMRSCRGRAAPQRGRAPCAPLNGSPACLTLAHTPHCAPGGGSLHVHRRADVSMLTFVEQESTPCCAAVPSSPRASTVQARARSAGARALRAASTGAGAAGAAPRGPAVL